ncbi:MAG: glycosyltransferase family 4 protein [candidate division WOR-3 bacterium]|jgi:glycosyltransferase involved in cell wall biosynthesis
MRILVINWRCPKNPLAGGAEIYLHEICRRLVRQGCQITLLAERFPGSTAEDELDGVRIIRRGNKWSKWTFNWTVYRQLNSIVHAGGFELVIDDLNKIPFYSPWLTDRPVLVLLMHLFRSSIFREVPAPLAAYVYLAESLIPLAYRNCRFAVLSESSLEDLVRLGIPAQRISVVPPGTDFERYHPAPAVRREPVILHVGRLKKYKSTDHLLYAAQRLKAKNRDFQVVIVGTGDDRPRLEKLASRLGINDRVRFTGFVNESEKIRWYQRSTVLVESSIKEGWGLIVMEANACGTPVVVARSPGLVDSSRDGVNGLFYEYGNIDQLTEKLDLLLTDQTLCQKLGNQAIDWAKQWTWDGAADKIYNLIRDTLYERTGS